MKQWKKSLHMLSTVICLLMSWVLTSCDTESSMADTGVDSLTSQAEQIRDDSSAKSDSDVFADTVTTADIAAATTQSSTSTTTTTTTTTTASTDGVPFYVTGSDSPNAALYAEQLYVAGDSIALGFKVYGFISEAHNLAKGSLAIWNMNKFPYNYGGQTMYLPDAVGYVKPKLLYLSMGMNDLNIHTAEHYAQGYVDLITQIRQKTPDTCIVVSAITPVSASCTFTSNAHIRTYNAALQTAVEGMGLSDVVFFDANAVLTDPATQMLQSGFSGGDGIHLGTQAYQNILQAMYRYLDTTAIVARLKGTPATTTTTTTTMTTTTTTTTMTTTTTTTATASESLGMEGSECLHSLPVISVAGYGVMLAWVKRSTAHTE